MGNIHHTIHAIDNLQDRSQSRTIKDKTTQHQPQPTKQHKMKKEQKRKTNYPFHRKQTHHSPTAQLQPFHQPASNAWLHILTMHHSPNTMESSKHHTSPNEVTKHFTWHNFMTLLFTIDLYIYQFYYPLILINVLISVKYIIVLLIITILMVFIGNDTHDWLNKLSQLNHFVR